MNYTWNKGLSLGMSAVLCLSSAVPAFAESQADQRNEKNEMVYVITDANGAVIKTIVSDWLNNFTGNDTLEDLSLLKDIENVKGDEEYTEGSNHELTWASGAQDIYYQGNYDGELPVSMQITYELEGQEVTAEQLAGKSGHVTIRYTYQSNLTRQATVGDHEETLCVPFAAVTGLWLDSEHFTNAEVTNGVLIGDGDRLMIAGYALPGLQESLAPDTDLITLPEYFEISADVTDFEMESSYTIITNEPFRKLSEECSSVSSDELIAKVKELTGGIEQLTTGVQSLTDGAASLDNGTQNLADGAASLSTGLHTLTENNDSLNTAANAVFLKLLATADEKLAAAGLDVPALTIDNYADVLDQTIASIKNQIAASMAGALTGSTKGAEAGMSTETEAAAQEAATETENTADAQAESGETTKAADAQAEVGETAQAADTQAASAGGTSALAQLAAAQEGISSLTELKASLDSYNEFYTGLQQYTAGVASADEGAAALYDGALLLKDGTASLADGTAQLNDGITTLSEQFTQKLDEYASFDLESLTQRFNALMTISGEYNNLSGISEDMNGCVYFIYRTGSISAE